MQIFINLVGIAATLGKPFIINNAERYDISDIRSLIRKKFNIPPKFDVIINKSDNTLENVNDIQNNDTLKVMIRPGNKMSVFEEIYPNYKDNKIEDINTFITTNTYEENDIVVVLWGNVIENTRNIRESIIENEEYQFIHNLLSQQLPIPIVMKALKQNTKTINLYLLDPTFHLKHGRKLDDIRNILDDIILENPSDATRLFFNGYEIYNIPALLVLDYLGINIENYQNILSGGGNERVDQWLKNIGLDSTKDFPDEKLEINNTTTMLKFYIIPFSYGRCATNPLNNKVSINPTKCLEELKDKLDSHRIINEYYLYLTSGPIPHDSYPILHNIENKYFAKKLTKWHNINESTQNMELRDVVLKGGKIPRKYVDRLSKKDKSKQEKNIRKSIRQYKKGKYIDRPKLKSYESKKSSWVTKFEKKYGEGVKTYKDISKVTGIPVKALKEVVKKGQGAYYSSGSRPNQTAESWGKARMYSYIMGGPTRKYDQHITDEYNVKLP